MLRIFQDNINKQYIESVVNTLKNGGVVIIPTDTVYALACSIESQQGIDKICRIKKVKLEKANFSFLCHSLSNISDYTQPFGTEIFRLMKNNLPGPFTFILKANNNVPSIFRHNKKTIGIRVPDDKIACSIIHTLNHPLMVTSLHDDDELMEYITDPDRISELWEDKVDEIIDGGMRGFEPSTVIDCSGSEPIIIREGKGQLQ